MSTTKKALAMADELAAELKIRLPALTVTQSYDTDENPLIVVGSGVAGTAGGFIKVMPIDWSLAKDVLGLASPVFTPHIVRLAVEANYAGATDNVADINTWPTQLALVAACVSRGARTEVWVETNGTAPTTTTFNTASKLKATYENLQYPMVSSQ